MARDQLTLGEAAIIAGLVKAPSNYSPTADVEAARGRANVVLKSMVDNGFISAAAAAAVDPAEIRLQPTAKQNSVRYFTDWALPQLDMLIDETSEPIEVWTTLDPGMQAAADRAVEANTPGGAQGALVALDRDGAVRAMVGGRDYVDSIYNRATQAERQPGSALKLFVYLAALEAGMKPTDTIVDEPVTIDGWSPRNSTRTYAGADHAARGLRALDQHGQRQDRRRSSASAPSPTWRGGSASPRRSRPIPSMVLGTSDVRLIDMTRAFAAVANRGRRGHALRHPQGGHRRRPTALPARAAARSACWSRHGSRREMTDLLQSAVLTGTGRAAQIGRPVAGKTGTTSSNKDGWFVGFSSGITTGVWMGRDDARPVAGLQGGTAPARAFHDFMASRWRGRPVEQFETEVPLPDWQLEPDEEIWGFADRRS